MTACYKVVALSRSASPKYATFAGSDKLEVSMQWYGYDQFDFMSKSSKDSCHGLRFVARAGDMEAKYSRLLEPVIFSVDKLNAYNPRTTLGICTLRSFFACTPIFLQEISRPVSVSTVSFRPPITEIAVYMHTDISPRNHHGGTQIPLA